VKRGDRDTTTRIRLGLLVVGVWALVWRPYLAASATPGPRSQPAVQNFDEINVKRINVVENSGKVRLVLCNSDKMPNPVVDGKEYPRSVRLAGMVFYKADGNECGGIGLRSTPNDESALMAFDFMKSEALGIVKSESKDGKRFDARLVLADRPPLDLPVEKANAATGERIVLANSNHDARLVLSDVEGHERIVLSVNAAGDARLQILDKAGRVISSLPK
jgi:hypothetical protein